MKTVLRPNQPPLVSIIIPVFNKCELTRQCLKALAEVTNHIPHEIIVVDNASSDATPQLMQSQPAHIRYHRNEVNRNFAAACNQGAALATGKQLLFLNNDTIPTRGWLDALLEEFRLHPEVAAAGAKLLYESGQIQHAGVIFGRETRNPHHPYRLLRMDDPRVNRRRELQAVTAACVLIRPKWFQDCGGFSEDFRNGYEDLDLCLKIRQRGGTIVYQPKSVVFHLESQTPGRMKFDNENRALFFQRWQQAVLADEDAYYFADGCYKVNRPDRAPELPVLVRFANEAERAQWQQVASSQTLAAQWDRPKLVTVLSNASAWPQDAAVRRWAGCLAHRLGIRDVAQQHFAAAQALEEDGHVRLLAPTAAIVSPCTGKAENPSAAALGTGFKALVAGNLQQAGTAFELALFQGASPALALTGLWRASQPDSLTAPQTRQALLELARLNQIVARQLAAPATAKIIPTTAAATVAKTPVTPVVSIIIPVFDKLELTRVCLDSLARIPAAVAHEIIVVDNASTDGTGAYLRQQESTGAIRVITNPRNAGFARACNQGAQAAGGKWLLFLNNDTQVLPNWLAALVKTAEQTQAGAVGAKLLYANGTIQHAGIGFINGLPDHPHRHAAADLPAANQRRELDMVTGACLLTPADLFRSLAGFDEVFRNGVEDVDYCLRVRAAGRKVVYEPQSVIYHHEGQSAGRFNHVNENLKIFFARWGKSFDPKTSFIVPVPPATIRASQSLWLTANVTPVSPAGAPPVTVAWEGSFLDHGSLSHVNRELVGELKALSVAQIHCVSNGGPMAADAATAWPVWFQEVSAASGPAAAITVRHAWPPKWQRPASGKLVVIQPWEFGSLPEAWVRQARDVDEFWLPTEYVRQVYVASGVPAEKVFVVPNGVDLEKFQPAAPAMALATAKKFKFLFVGGTIGRKGPDLLLRAYMQHFTAADDVCLVIKDFGGQSVYTGQTFEASIRATQALPNAPEILYLNQELPPEQLPGLYTACDCLVMPYRGEGFGLPAIEAMACGRPLIVTGGGATDDFVGDEFAWRIPAERRVFGQEVSGMKLVQPGWLLEPDLAALGAAMRSAFGDPAEARRRGQLARDHAQNWSWKKAAAAAAQRLQALAANTAGHGKTAAPAPAPLPAVAAIGQLDEARELFAQKDFAAAWTAALTAITQRPFHPEAYLLLAEIALAAGDGKAAKVLAHRARDFAPGWIPVKQFLVKPLKGTTRPAWLDLARCTPKKARVSVCLIVKNEEQFIAQCLKSVRGLAAQIVVVDTGSTDRTVEIAQEFGAQIHSFPWCDDFAAARNAALEHATGDWVLMLDADEELPPEQHAKLVADLKADDVIARRMPLVNVGREAEGRSVVPRLFRNAPGVFFRGRIHEQVFASLLAQGKKWGLKTALGTAELRHHGYAKELVVDRNKVARNLKLLQLALAEDPTDVNLVMNLGLELVHSEQLAAGLQQYRQAYEMMAAQPEAELVPELREVLFTQLTSQLYKVREHAEVVRLLTSPLARHGSGLTGSLHFSLGLSHFELRQYREAADQMRQCWNKRKQPALTPINTDILTAAPQHCLALSLAKLGETAGAEAAFKTALAEADKTEAAKLDYARFLLAADRPVEALTQLNELVSQNNQHEAAWKLGGEIALSQADFLEFAGDWTAEALKARPDNPALAAQRAEALMLAGHATEAAPLWENLWRSEPQDRSLAALILCELLTQPTTRAPEAGEAEAATSRAFIEWYQKLIAVRAQAVTERINEHMEKLARALPAAAQMLATALTEAAS